MPLILTLAISTDSKHSFNKIMGNNIIWFTSNYVAFCICYRCQQLPPTQISPQNILEAQVLQLSLFSLQPYNHYIIILMKKTFLLLLILISASAQGTNDCTIKSTYISPSSMSKFIAKYIDSITPDDALVNLIVTPSNENIINYSKTLMPFVIPIFAFAVIATLFMIVACFQICCVGCCNSQKCKCTSYSYSSVKIITALIILFLLLLIGGGITGMIFNHDTMASSVNTGCVANGILTSIISGDNNSDWMGLSNLTSLTQNMSLSYSNNIGSLASYFDSSSTSSTYANLTTGNFYQNVMDNTNCTSISGTQINCPDSTATNCEAVFINNFCGTSGSFGQQRITKQFNNTVQVYANTLINLAGNISTMNGTPSISNNLINLVSQVSSLSNSSKQYQQGLSSITQSANYGLYITEISIYVAYSFLILCSFCSIMVLTFILCCRCFKLTGCVQFSWMFYWFMTTIIFIIAGIQYLASVAIVNGCQAYTYFNSSQSNFDRIPQSDLTRGYASCLFQNGTSLMGGAFPSTQIQPFNDVLANINILSNVNNFSTVATSVYDQVMNFYYYPDTVQIVNPTTNVQPNEQLQILNTYANYSATSSSQSCHKLKDHLVFNSYNCTPYPVVTGTSGQGNNSCVLLNNTSTINDRQNILNSVSCNNAANYLDYSTNLQSYASSLQAAINSTVLITPILNAYPQNYYTYTQQLQQFISPPVEAQINSFIGPYNQLSNGLSCSYAVTNINQMETQVCNNFNPFLYFLAVINIIIGSVCFCIMILFYFLHPRLEFYAKMEGNSEKMQLNTAMDDSNMRELVETTQRKQYF